MPQFINVLMGDMSVVGPRPHMLKHTEEYAQVINKFMVRHFVKPGITGWAQVTGYRGETKELWQMEGGLVVIFGILSIGRLCLICILFIKQYIMLFMEKKKRIN